MRKPYPYRASTCELTPAAWRCSLQSVALASLISSRFPREDAAADYKCDHSQNEYRELHLLHRVFSVAGYYRGGRAISAPSDDGGAVSSRAVAAISRPADRRMTQRGIALACNLLRCCLCVAL